MARAAAKALRTMPLEAVPASMDLLLEATGARASSLLHEIAALFPQFAESESHHIEALMASVLHLLKASDGNPQRDVDVVVELCIPLLSVLSPSSTKASKLLAESVASKLCWNYAVATLLPCCLSSISGSPNVADECHRVSFPLLVACQVVVDLINAACDRTESEAADFTNTLVEAFWHPSLKLAGSTTDDSIRSVLIQTLLPSLLKAQQRRSSCNISDLWLCSKVLLRSGSSQRRDAYKLLSTIRHYLAQGDFDVGTDPQFWETVRHGLVDADSLTRKRALEVLKAALNCSQLTKSAATCKPATVGTTVLKKKLSKRDKWAEEEANSGRREKNHTCSEDWKAFLLLYDILEEYGIHLIEAAWRKQVESIMVRILSEQPQAQLQKGHMNFLWVAILFGRGLKHGNPQVRRMILDSFFSLDWGKGRTVSSVVPRDFVLTSLVQALNEPVHHKDFGLDGVYSSKTMERAAKFFQAYTSSLYLGARAEFINGTCQSIVKQYLCRPGLMSLASCIEAVATVSEFPFKNADPTSLLDSLRLIVESSREHFNSNYRTKVCSHVLGAMTKLVPLPELPFEKLSTFLAAFPRECLVVGGSSFGTFSSWLGPSDDGQESIICGLRKGLWTFLKPPASSLVSDHELDLWKEESGKWARILAIGVRSEDRQRELLQLVEQHALEIYRRAYMPILVAEKILLLLQSILQEFPSASTRTELQLHLVDFVSRFLGELVSHADKCARAFWQYDYIKGASDFPVTGRLGGASQRRLPPHATSTVIQMIVAFETLSKCIIWLFRSPETGLEEPVSSFLLAIGQRFLQNLQVQEELRAEFSLAAVEALSSICKTLPCISSSLDSEPDDVIDIMTERLLELSSNVCKDGKLARSRIHVLTLHKWSCLEGLLSIEKANHTGALSGFTLKRVLEDCLESMESASENYILPLFRCLRLLIHRGVDISVQVMWDLVEAGWSSIVDCNKKRIAPLAAFLSAFLHPAIFVNRNMHVTPETEGPVKWLVNRLIEMGSRSPRTMRLTALHLTGLWLEYPTIALLYIPELKSMTLHGSEHLDEEVDGEIVDHDGSIVDYAILVRNSDPELLEAFANTEMFTRVSVAVMMDKFADLGEKGTAVDDSAAAKCGRALLFKLLEAASDQKDLGKELYRRKSILHRRKIRAWQMLCILSRFTDETSLAEVIQMLDLCLHRNNMPSVRQYIEVFAVQIHLRFPSLVKQHLVPLLHDCNMKTQALSSYVFVAANLITHATSEAAQMATIKQVLPAMLPHMTNHHHNLRTFSQVLIFQVLGTCRRNPALCEELGPACLLAIGSYLEGNADCARVRQSVEEHLHSLNPAAASKARGIFCERRGDLSKASEERPLECVPISVVDQIADFLNEAREELRESMASDALSVSFGKSQQQELNASSNHHHSDYQKKITPYGDAMQVLEEMEADIEYEDDLLLATIETRGRELAKTHKNRQELIVVASLIDRIPNLAGLARTCEVFKAAALTVADLRVKDDKQFKLISVTADQWVPMLEVAEAGLDHFLKKKRSEGYILVGLEQTANSLAIDHYAFPKKTVLVLGHEKEGIPVDIIQTLHACVEIPQLGVIRSLNVHVSGAIAVWEYTRQHLKS